MKLAAKGHFAPPPTLPKHAQSLSEAIASWTGVEARTHWLLGDETQVDGADFYLGDEELGHLHLDGEAHVAVGTKVRAALIAGGHARPFRYSAAFVVYRIANADDAAHAQRLFALSFDRRAGCSEQDLLAKVAALPPLAPKLQRGAHGRQEEDRA